MSRLSADEEDDRLLSCAFQVGVLLNGDRPAKAAIPLIAAWQAYLGSCRINTQTFVVVRRLLCASFRFNLLAELGWVRSEMRVCDHALQPVPDIEQVISAARTAQVSEEIALFGRVRNTRVIPTIRAAVRAGIEFRHAIRPFASGQIRVQAGQLVPAKLHPKLLGAVHSS